MKRHLAALALGAFLLTTSAHGVTLTLNGAPFAVDAAVQDNTTFVPLRAVAQALCSDAAVSWEGGQAVLRCGSSLLTARPGEETLAWDGQPVALSSPVQLAEGRTLVPLRPLAAFFGADVHWDADTGAVHIVTAQDPAAAREPDSTCDGDALYWLSRIISAESQGEPWEGKIAVGNVVLNRVASPLFPDTIYGVIFDDRWGGQFEPVRNGTVYNEPTEESVRAAIACLAGENTVGDSLYFLAPDLTDNHWTMDNRTYITTIGAHWFYE